MLSRDFPPFLGGEMGNTTLSWEIPISRQQWIRYFQSPPRSLCRSCPTHPRLPGPLCLLLFSPSSDTKKDLKQITSHLLDMLVSKKVSGQGRDQALNLLNKNVPRKNLSIHDNSRTIYVVDNGEVWGASGAPPSLSGGSRVGTLL